jgi:hypothetical protein
MANEKSENAKRREKLGERQPAREIFLHVRASEPKTGAIYFHREEHYPWDNGLFIDNDDCQSLLEELEAIIVVIDGEGVDCRRIKDISKRLKRDVLLD